MDQRGRKSGAQLTDTARFPVSRIEAPGELTEPLALIWYEIVASQHADFVNSGNAPLLAALCRHVQEERRLGDTIDNFKTECLETEDGLKRYDLLTKNHDRQSKAIISLARQLRLTNQSRYRADKADTLSRRVPALLEVPDEVEIEDDES
jgi:hypothetical protein